MNDVGARAQKRAKKPYKERAREMTEKSEKPNAPKANPESIETHVNPYAMFKQGLLVGVFEEGSVKPIVTRFPLEPFLHLGHAKAIAINFGFPQFHGGRTVSI